MVQLKTLFRHDPGRVAFTKRRPRPSEQAAAVHVPQADPQ